MTGQRPVVIVGCGVAGLSAALACAPRPVLLLSRGRNATGSASVLAQGGIAAAVDPADSGDAHARDTIAAGAGHNDASMVRQLVAAAPAAIAWLQSQGVVFDQHGSRLALGREGGHGVARIVHAGGDRTGAVVTAALVERARAASHIHWRGEVDIGGLLLRGGRVAGVRATDQAGHNDVIEADAVVLATGGLGALFARTTNPPSADGAGLALALAAGARARDLEFMQFHPTALDVQAVSLPLVTEALRGAGARLLVDAVKPLMEGVHPQGDLAPRDVVARQAWQASRAGGAVALDARGLAVDWQREFPTVLGACLAHGIDPRSTLVPVTPAAHFHMGGLAVDAFGRTTVPDLWAVGEVACTGVHGANRLASNSLLEGVVFGRRLGSALAEARGPIAASGETVLVELGAGLPADQLHRLRTLLWDAAGPMRRAAGLQSAIARVDAMAEQGWQARLARRVLTAADRRRCSIGAHWRDDAPQADHLCRVVA